MAQGIDLSFLTEDEQVWVLDAMVSMNVIPSMEQSAELKEHSQKQTLKENVVYQILAPKTAGVKARKVTIKAKKLDAYFAPHYSSEEIEDIIIGLLEEWKKGEQ